MIHLSDTLRAIRRRHRRTRTPHGWWLLTWLTQVVLIAVALGAAHWWC